MTEIKVADKPTLDKVKTDTELIMELLNSGNLGGAPFGFNVDIPKAEDKFEVLPSNLSVDSTSSAVAIDGEIYAVGSNIAPYNQTSKYSPETELWIALAPCPSMARRSKSVELNGEIYTLGGQSPVADSFTEAGSVTSKHSPGCCGNDESDIPEEHKQHFTEVVEAYTVKDGEIIETKEEQTIERRNAFTEWAATGEYNLDLRKYNPATNEWTMLAESPTGCRCVSFFAHKGKLYIVGGDEYSIYEYDPLTTVWREIGKVPPMNRAVWGVHFVPPAFFYLVYTPLNAVRGSVLRYDYNRQATRYMPEAEYVTTFSSSAVYDGDIYIFGAGGLLHTYRKTIKFNPATEQWTELADREFSAEDSCAVTFGDDIYVFGGQTSPFTQVTKYTPTTDTWETLKDAPFALRHSSVAAFGSEIFAVGQWGSFAKYDPATDTWTTLTGAPTDLTHTSTIAHSHNLYVLGTSREPANAFRRYNPATDTWTDLANTPEDTFRAKVIPLSANNSIIIAFGGSRAGSQTRVWHYGINGNAWNPRVALPELSQYSEGVSEIVADNLFVFQDRKVVRGDIERLEWRTLGDAPVPITKADIVSLVNHTGSLFLFGDVFRIYNISRDTWSVMATPLYGAWEADCVGIGDTAYVLGSGTKFQKYIAWGGWLLLSDLPNGQLTGVTAAERDGILFLLGGENPPHNQFLRHDLRTQTWERLTDCPIDVWGGALAIIENAPPPLPDLNITQIFIPVGRANRPGRENQMLYVTIHETDNTNAGSNARGHAAWLNAEGTTVSWHYTVDDTETVQHLPENEDAFHSGDGSGNGNRHSIGVEICVNEDGDFPQAVKRATQLVADICNRRNIPIAHVVQHHHWSGKNCPIRIRAGYPYSWQTFLDNVFANMTGDAIYAIEGTRIFAYVTEWNQLQDLADPFENGSLAVLNGEIYVAGSGTPFRKYSPVSRAWVDLASCPVDASFSALTAIDGLLYLVGGNIAPHTQISRYDPKADAWEELTPCPNSAYNAVAAAIRGSLFVVGSGGYLNIYNPNFDLWEVRQARIPNVEGAAAVMVDDSMIIAGGETPLIQVTPSARFINQLVAEVKEGQRIFYSSGSSSAFLRFNGDILPHGESEADRDGQLVTDVSDNSENFIRGWVQ